jgi:hypothetical protein
MTQRVAVVGAAGRLGSVLAAGIAETDDLELVAAVSPSHAGRTLGEVARGLPAGAPGAALVVAAGLDALLDADADVAVEVTGPATVGRNLRWLLEHGIHAVVGATGLAEDDLEAARRSPTPDLRGRSSSRTSRSAPCSSSASPPRRPGTSRTSRSSSCTTTARSTRRPGPRSRRRGDRAPARRRGATARGGRRAGRRARLARLAAAWRPRACGATARARRPRGGPPRWRGAAPDAAS